MTTTRVITTWNSGNNRPARDTLAAVAGDHVGDYDLEAAEDDYLAAINAALPEGLSLARNGEVFGPADWTGKLDIAILADAINVSPFLEAHDTSST